jgi:hypothetical protein
MPASRIQSHTRHKSAEVLAGYIREAHPRPKKI